jgi:small subunit ribosomal protein S13
MIRIAGVTLPNKQIEIALTYVHGIGRPTARKLCHALKINIASRANDLAEEDVAKLRELIEKNYRLEGELRRDVMSNIKRLKEIGSLRGIRHGKSLPVRGQRTRTNSRTVRGNTRKTMGSGKRALTKT